MRCSIAALLAIAALSVPPALADISGPATVPIVLRLSAIRRGHLGNPDSKKGETDMANKGKKDKGKKEKQKKAKLNPKEKRKQKKEKKSAFAPFR